MGAGISFTYGHLRRVVLRYNAQYRAHRLLEKNKLPRAPRHPVNIDENQIFKEKPQLKKELEGLHDKNEQLNQYLKQVYLTSTSTKTKDDEDKPKRPLPLRRGRDLQQMFYEPEKAAPGFCTLTNVLEMMVKYNTDSETWTPTTLAQFYNMDKKDVVQLFMYYSLLKIEKFEFMNEVEPKNKESETDIEFEVFTRLEKKPRKLIEDKK